MLLSLGAAYGWSNVDMQRTASFTGYADRLSGHYHAGTAQAFAEAGYLVDLGETRLEPFINLADVSLHTDGFNESGGSAALNVSSSTLNTAFTTLGLRAETDLPFASVRAKLSGMIGWRHAFGDIVPTSVQAFSGGDVFTVAGVPIAEDAATVEAGLDFDIGSKAKLALTYEAQIGSGSEDQSGQARFAVRF